LSLVGPKARPKGVVDGHQVYIPEPVAGVISDGVTRHSWAITGLVVRVCL